VRNIGNSRKGLPKRRQGSISVVALIICAVGTMGLLGIVSIMQARVVQVDAMEEECLRHIRESNGRQLAKDFAFRRIWTSASGDAETVEIPAGWGRITVPAWNRTAFTTTMRATVYNQSGPDPSGLPYQMSVDVSVFSRVDPETGDWITVAPRTVSTRIQSRPLANAGVLLDARSQNAVATVSGNLNVHGKAMIWQGAGSDNSFSFNAAQLYGYSGSVAKSNVEVQDLSGAGALAPRNLPGLTLPNWFAAAGSTLAPGAYPVIFNDDWAPFYSNAIAPSIEERAIAIGAISLAANTSYNRFGAVCNGAGVVTVDLNSLNLPSLVLDSPLSLTITGQTSAAARLAVENLAPVVIVIRSATLPAINFTGGNARPLIVALTSNDSASLTLSFGDGADYRLHLLADRQPLVLNSAGTSTLRGGIATDDDLTVGAGTFHLRAETAHPEWFDQLLWRSFWVETYQQL